MTSSCTCNCFQRDTSSGDLKELTITLYTRYDFNFRAKGEAYCNSWIVSGYAREVKNGFVTFLLNWKDSRHSYEMVERNIDSEQSLIFLKGVVRSRVSCEHGEAARLVSRVYAAPRSQSWQLDKTRYFWCDTRGSMVISILTHLIYMVKICL